VAELADAHGLGPCGFTPVKVRVLSGPPSFRFPGTSGGPFFWQVLLSPPPLGGAITASIVSFAGTLTLREVRRNRRIDERQNRMRPLAENEVRSRCLLGMRFHFVVRAVITNGAVHCCGEMRRVQHDDLTPKAQCTSFIFALALAFLDGVPTFAVSTKSQIVVRELRSGKIAHSKTGTDPVRKMLVYLLAGYDESSSQRANFDHVYANQAFTHKLNEFGIIHGAEEYNGAFGADWGVDGRIFTDALPFFQRHLVFDSNKDQSQIEPRDITTWTEQCHRIKGSH
jgi:hypothetical protein